MTPNVIERLDGKLADLEIDVNDARAALAAVEQEMAELRAEIARLNAEAPAWVALAEADGTKQGLLAVGNSLIAKDAEIAELRKDAWRWRGLRMLSGLSLTEDGQVDLFALVADSDEEEDAPWLTDSERRALDGELTHAEPRMRNGWVWDAGALDRAVDAAIAAAGDTIDTARAEGGA